MTAFNDVKLSFDDIARVPNPNLSPIDSRGDVNPKYANGQSPFFVSPMDTIIDINNFQLFLDQGLNVVLPRGLWKLFMQKHSLKQFESYITNQQLFFSFSLTEIIDFVDSLNHNPFNDYSDTSIFIHSALNHLSAFTIHIDVANGHMESVYNISKFLKDKYGEQLILMVGNIANPKTVKLYADIGVDYLKMGIGTGSACRTSSKTAIHYPPASLLLDSLPYTSSNHEKSIKLIADGGIKNFAHANLALSCGADYVMMGGMFAKTYEACSYNNKKYVYNEYNFIEEISNRVDFTGLYNLYRGMSTVEVQNDQHKKNIRPSEGLIKYVAIEYYLKDFVKDLEFSLRSAMSYVGNSNLEDFITEGYKYIIRISPNAKLAIND
jgi:GMP reductase